MISPNQVHQARRMADAEVTLADISRAKQLLRWKPKVSLEQGIAEMMERIIENRSQGYCRVIANPSGTN